MMRTGIVAPILLLVLVVLSADTIFSPSEAFAFAADHLRARQRQGQQQQIEFLQIRSAVAFGRSETDDSEWYHPPPLETTTAPTNDAENTNTINASSIRSDSMVDTNTSNNSKTRSLGVYTVRQTTIASVPQFYSVLGTSSPSLLLSDDATIANVNSIYFHEEESDELIIVKFFASWCKSCQKVGYKIDQLISDLSIGTTTTTTESKQRKLHILHVDYTTMANRELFVQHNITQLPTIHIYEKRPPLPNQELTTFRVLNLPCPPHQFHKVRNWIVSYYNKKKNSQQQQRPTDSAVLDFGHDIIESTVLPMLQRTTTTLSNQKNEKTV